MATVNVKDFECGVFDPDGEDNIVSRNASTSPLFKIDGYQCIFPASSLKLNQSDKSVSICGEKKKCTHLNDAVEFACDFHELRTETASRECQTGTLLSSPLIDEL